jgi:hypothetical protein
MQQKGRDMKNIIRSAALAIAMVSVMAPDAAQAQAPAPAKSTAKKPHKPTNEERWNSMLNSMAVLAHEGAEVKRVTPAEKTQIDGTILKVKAQIAAAKKDGISEVEEDAIDAAIANEMTVIAKAMSDEPRKKANPIVPTAAKK